MITDSERVERYLSFPETITTTYDLKIKFSKDLEYKITEMKSAWLYYSEDSDYACQVSSFKLNGKLNKSEISNIVIRQPSFKYPLNK